MIKPVCKIVVICYWFVTKMPSVGIEKWVADRSIRDTNRDVSFQTKSIASRFAYNLPGKNLVYCFISISVSTNLISLYHYILALFLGNSYLVPFVLRSISVSEISYISSQYLSSMLCRSSFTLSRICDASIKEPPELVKFRKKILPITRLIMWINIRLQRWTSFLIESHIQRSIFSQSARDISEFVNSIYYIALPESMSFTCYWNFITVWI